MSKEAIKLALKDLKWIDNWLCEKPMPECVARLRKSIKALEEALAKQEQGEPMDWSDEQLKMLNFLYGAGDFDGVWFEQKHPTEKGAFWWRKHMKRLFDTTPQQRTWERQWVSLTDVDRMELYKLFVDSDEWTYEKAIEARLKEKNT